MGSMRVLQAATLSLLLVEAPVSADERAPETSKPAPPRAPYSLPWFLRPAPVATVARLDSVFASSRTDTGEDATTFVSVFTAVLPLADEVGVSARLGLVHHEVAATGPGTAVLNPVLTAFWSRVLSHGLRTNVSLALAPPVGMGGGNTPDPAVATAVRAGVLARTAVDGSLFAVNDLSGVLGLGLAWIANGWTVQVDAGVVQAVRMRGNRSLSVPGLPPTQANPDRAKTNLITGVHVGWFASAWASLGGELRLQRWLSTPAAVAAVPAVRETASASVGGRLHLPVGGAVAHPGLSLTVGLDDPMRAREYLVVQLDLPVVF
jgi:hypothetical protein